MAKITAGVGPKLPQIVVLFGATGDLSRRKLLPGLARLVTAGFLPRCRKFRCLDPSLKSV